MVYRESTLKKLHRTMIKKHGSLEKWREVQRQIASKGGKVKTNDGFAHGKVDPRTARNIRTNNKN